MLAPVSIEARAVRVQDLPQFRAIDGARLLALTERERSGMADRVPVREALGGDAGRSHRFVLSGETASGHEDVLAPPRYEAAIRDFVVVIQKPGHTRHGAFVQLDRPS